MQPKQPITISEHNRSMTTSVTKVFGSFCAAHQLPQHFGKCQNLHGHNYVVTITATAPVQETPGSSENGMVVDFGILKDIYQARVHNVLDHSVILGTNLPRWYNFVVSKLPLDAPNTEQAQVDVLFGKIVHLPIPETTAELLAGWIMKSMNDAILDSIDTAGILGADLPYSHELRVTAVTVEETESSSATVTRLAAGDMS